MDKNLNIASWIYYWPFLGFCGSGQIKFSFCDLLHCTKDLEERLNQKIMRQINSNILQKDNSAITWILLFGGNSTNTFVLSLFNSHKLLRTKLNVRIWFFILHYHVLVSFLLPGFVKAWVNSWKTKFIYCFIYFLCRKTLPVFDSSYSPVR